MPKQSERSKYFTFTKKQGENFIKEIKEIIENKIFPSLTNLQKEKANQLLKEPFIKDYFRACTKIINDSYAPNSKYYLSGLDYLYGISNLKICFGIPYSKIENLLLDFFNDYDFINPEKNPKDIGCIEEIYKHEIDDRNKIEVLPSKLLNKTSNQVNTTLEKDFIIGQLQKYDWALYTYGEKYISSKGGDDKQKRIFYLKERPTIFENGRIILKNTDDVEIVFQEDHPFRKGIRVVPNSLHYEGNFDVFEQKNKDKNSLVYLETDALAGENGRHLRIMLVFGEGIGNIALGTFSSIKDLGTLLAGAALLVKKEKGFFKDNDCQFYTTFKDSPLEKSVRMLLEKRSRAYVKLPRKLDKYTLADLDANLTRQKINERDNWETREATIHRKDVFVSIPLRCNGNGKNYNLNVKFLNKFVEVLKNNPFNLTQVTFGIINQINTPANQLPSSKDEYESNFDKIIQSNIVVFLFPTITFPYEGNSIKATLNNEIPKISTSFIELGFALGLRKKILILTSEKVNKVLPSVVSEFAKGENVNIIECEFETLPKFESSIQFNLNLINKFIDKHLDYKVVNN
jgi:hypothetical protein